MGRVQDCYAILAHIYTLLRLRPHACIPQVELSMSDRFARLRKTTVHKKSSIIYLPIVLSLLGLLFVFESSSVRALQEFGDSFHYFKLQAVWIGLGIVGMMFFSFFNYKKLYYLSFPAMMTTIGMLMLVLLPGLGSTAGGAQSWINFGFFNIQPTELAKFSVIIYLASWFMNREKKRFVPFISLLGFLVFIIILQPDLGTATMIFILSIVMYYLAGTQLGYLVLLLPASLIGFYVLTKISPYRMRRFSAFLNPSLDPLGIGYHVNQIAISLQNGGLFGLGFGASRQKFLYLPEAHTDSIFAIIGEEFGFVGSAMLIFALIVLIYKIYEIAYKAPDRFARLLAGGIFVYFSIQIVVNLGGMVGLMPLTGVPLPFISYGGSNLLISFAMIGILLNIRKKGHIK